MLQRGVGLASAGTDRGAVDAHFPPHKITGQVDRSEVGEEKLGAQPRSRGEGRRQRLGGDHIVRIHNDARGPRRQQHHLANEGPQRSSADPRLRIQRVVDDAVAGHPKLREAPPLVAGHPWRKPDALNQLLEIESVQLLRTCAPQVVLFQEADTLKVVVRSVEPKRLRELARLARRCQVLDSLR